MSKEYMFKSLWGKVRTLISKKLYRALLWMAVLALMAVIFAFSAQPGEVSDEMTTAAVLPLAELVASMQQGDTAATVTMLYNIIGTVVRKLAHVCEYALLGFLVYQLLQTYHLQKRWLPILLCVAYAVTDEVHQYFVPARSGRATDVLIDAIGVFCGVYATDVIRILRRKRKEHQR